MDSVVFMKGLYYVRIFCSASYDFQPFIGLALCLEMNHLFKNITFTNIFLLGFVLLTGILFLLQDDDAEEPEEEEEAEEREEEENKENGAGENEPDDENSHTADPMNAAFMETDGDTTVPVIEIVSGSSLVCFIHLQYIYICMFKINMFEMSSNDLKLCTQCKDMLSQQTEIVASRTGAAWQLYCCFVHDKCPQSTQSLNITQWAERGGQC